MTDRSKFPALFLTALALAAMPAHAQEAETLAGEDDIAAYCLGVNRQLAERFRQMQLWGCGKAAAMQWCRDAKESAPEAMRARERLVIRFANELTRKGPFRRRAPARVPREADKHRGRRLDRCRAMLQPERRQGRARLRTAAALRGSREACGGVVLPSLSPSS